MHWSWKSLEIGNRFVQAQKSCPFYAKNCGRILELESKSLRDPVQKIVDLDIVNDLTNFIFVPLKKKETTSVA